MRSLEITWEVFGCPRGGPWEVPEVLGEATEAPKREEVFSERPGGILEGSWGGFGALGWSDLANGNVDISDVLEMLW